jgi:KipI family sensor histidine kinase inhibitor
MIRVGESAWLLELGSTAEVLAAQRLVDARAAGELRDLVPGATTLLLLADPDRPLDPRRLAGIEEEARHAARHDEPGRTHEIAVRYDGPDLAELAARAGMAADDLVARHAGAAYRVAVVGFQPGFAYLAGLPPALHAPRRASPRPRVPAGSVAIGGAWTGIYPLASPGGWNLIGSTEAVLFDPSLERPALLEPGDVVRFVPR